MRTHSLTVKGGGSGESWATKAMVRDRAFLGIFRISVPETVTVPW
ncbi:MAG: hypothetical protein RBR16_00600 [Syntrophus sp. (in: bacteria)]|nr:hypothetical protein [Syntrophus sp. (in: bacteria)]